MDTIASLSPPGGTTFVGLSGRPVHITSPFRLVPHLAKAVHRQVVALGDKPRVRKALTATAIGSGITLSALYAARFRTAADGESSGKSPEAAVVKAMAFKWLDYPADYISPSMDVNAIDDFPLGVSSSAYVSPKYSESELALAFIKFRHSIKVPHDTKFVFDFRGFGTGFAIVTALGVIAGLSITVRARCAAGLVSPDDAKVSCGLSQGGSSPGFALNIPLVNVDGSLTVHADLAICDARVDISCTQRPDLLMAPVDGYASVIFPPTGKVIDNSVTTLNARDRNIFYVIGLSIVKYIVYVLAFLLWVAIQLMAFRRTGRPRMRHIALPMYFFKKGPSETVRLSLPTPIEASAAVDDGFETERDHSNDFMQGSHPAPNEVQDELTDSIASSEEGQSVLESVPSSPFVQPSAALADFDDENFSDALEDLDDVPSGDLFVQDAVDTAPQALNEERNVSNPPLSVATSFQDIPNTDDAVPTVDFSDAPEDVDDVPSGDLSILDAVDIAPVIEERNVSSPLLSVTTSFQDIPNTEDAVPTVESVSEVVISTLSSGDKGKSPERSPSETLESSDFICLISTSKVSKDRWLSSSMWAPTPSPITPTKVEVDRSISSSMWASATPSSSSKPVVESPIDAHIRSVVERALATTASTSQPLFVPRPPAAPVTMTEPRRRRRHRGRNRGRGSRAQQEDGEDTRSEAGPSGEQGISA